MDFTIAGVVILYDPETDVLSNIQSYIKSLDCLFVVNNHGGDAAISELNKLYENIHVIQEKENMGISYPLNQVLQLCNKKYDFLMTMDQDSIFHDHDMKRYILEIPKFDWNHTLGIGPKKVSKDLRIPENEGIEWRKVIRTITSGNIVNVQNAIAVGGYNEDLFIDEVDFEFCYRGAQKNFDIYECTTGIYLRHSVGNRTMHSFAGFKYYSWNHSPVRKYYIIRNRLYCYKRYAYLNRRDFNRMYLWDTLKNLVKIPLTETDKLKKLKYCALGFWDYYHHKVGKKYFD